MAISKGKIEGGQGGKRAHSNMDHWEFTEEIKLAARKRRRLAAKAEIKLALTEFENDESTYAQRQLEDKLS